MRDWQADSMLHLTSYTICHTRQVSRVPCISTYNNWMKMMAGFSSIGTHLHRSGVWIIERCGREGWSNWDVCLPAKSISQVLLGWGRQLMGKLCYPTLKDTRAGHHHACPLYFLPQEGRQKDGSGKGQERNDRDKKKTEREAREVQQQKNWGGVALLQLYNWPARVVKWESTYRT